MSRMFNRNTSEASEILSFISVEYEILLFQVMTDRGFEREIKSLPIECSFCPWIGILNKYQVTLYIYLHILQTFFFLLKKDHLDQSHPNPECEHCDQPFDSVKHLNEHTVFQCEKVTVNCLLKDFGCDEQV